MSAVALLAFIFIILAIILSVVIWSIKNGISPMPTSPKVKKKLLDALPKNMEGKIIDLGSGWGTLVFPLAQKYPSCKVVGYEDSPIPYFYSKLKQKLANIPNSELEYRNFYKIPLVDAKMVICYLYPGAMQRLKSKFDKELQPGTLVISHTFAIPGWIPDRTIQANDIYKTKIYFYIKD